MPAYRQSIIRLLFYTCMVFVTGFASAANTPEDIPGSTKVDAEGLIGLIDTFDDELLLIDARIETDRRQGFIEGSLSLPDTETDCDTLAVTIPAKTSPVLFYCNGVKCGRSVKSVRKALACGYGQVYWFRGGFEEWTAKDYPVIRP